MQLGRQTPEVHLCFVSLDKSLSSYIHTGRVINKYRQIIRLPDKLLRGNLQ